MTINYLESLKNQKLYSYSPKEGYLEGESKMYNARDSEELEGIPAGMASEGVIIKITDGKSRDFIKSEEAKKEWQGDLDQPAIDVEIETKYKEKSFKLSKLFTYSISSDNGKTMYGPTSNLGKYKAYYNKLPEIGDKVKLLSNKKGFFRILIE